MSRHALLLTLAACCGQAIAGPAAEPPLEEVVVSGFRVEPARETGLSLTLLDAVEIEQAAVTHLEELLPLVPNLNLSGEGSRARYLQLRGIGEREQYEGAPNPSVGLFIDDIDLSGLGGVVTVFDMAGVEVLRGPQSVRFGGSALAGVIYTRTADPGPTPEMRVSLSGGSDALRAGGATVGGALGASVQGRLSVSGARSDGFRDNVFTGAPTSHRDEKVAHGKLGWSFGEGWDALATVMWADADNGYDAWTVRNDDRTHSDWPGRDAQRTAAGSLRLTRTLASGAELVSITSLADTDVDFRFDGDWGNPGFWDAYGGYVYDYRYDNPRQRDTLGQELRLVSAPGAIGGHTGWVAGVYWRALDEDNHIDSTGVYDDSAAENWCAPCLTGRQVDSRFESRNQALFAGTETAFARRWTLSTGLRLEHWRARYRDDWQDINYPLPPGGSSCANFDCDPGDLLWGGHLALGLELSPRVNAYARLARGFKAGGFNPSLAALQGVAVLGPEFIAYRPETLDSLEAGLKGEWLDGALAADLALFAMDRGDAQLSQSSQQVPFDPNSFVYVTYNGAARVRGLEASAQWRPFEPLRVYGALGLLDSRVADTAATRAVSPTAVGRALAHAPRWNGNLGMAWQSPAGWFGRLDLDGMAGFYYDISHDQRADSRWLVNLRAGRAFGDWSVSAWVRNLTDEAWHTRGFYFGNEPPGFAPTLYTRFGDPRQWGLSLDWRRGGG